MSIQTEAPASKLQLGLMWSRMKKASRLDQQGVLELKTDTTSTGQAVAVLVLAALAYGISYTAQTQFQRHDVSIYWFQGTVAVAAVVWLFISQVFTLKQVMGLSLRRTVLTVAVGLLILAFIGIQFGTG